MANKAISELPQAQNVNNQDLFVLEQSGIAKKLTAETFITEQGIIDALAEALDGHGGIQSVTLSSVSGRIRTYRITFTDQSATTFQVYDGTSIDRISRTSSSGLDDVYTIFLSDGTTTFFTVHNGADGTVSEAMLNDALAKKAPAITETTESSAIANFTDGADDMAMYNVVAEINPAQDLNGYDNPWPAGGGKNLFQTTATAKTQSGVTWTVNDDGSITVTGTATGYTDLVVGEAVVAGLSETVTVYGDVNFNNNIVFGTIKLFDSNEQTLATIYGGGTTTTHTVDLSQYVDAYKIIIILKRNNNVATSGTYHIQVVKGTTVPAWTPYSNICPITGHTEVNVMRAGKNLFDQATVLSSLGFGLQSDGSWLYTGDSYWPVYEQKVWENTAGYTGRVAVSLDVKYGTSGKIGLYFKFVYTDGTTESIVGSATGDFVSTSAVSNASKTVDYIMTYFSYNANQSSTAFKNVQIELGSSATAYEAYITPATATLSWQTEAGTVYGGTIDVATGVLTVDRAMVDMGTLTWNRTTSYSAPVFYSNVVGKLHSNISLLCSEYKFIGNFGSAAGFATNSENVSIGNCRSNEQIFARDDSYTDAATFKSAMNGVQLVYELATPQTYQLSGQQLMTLLGTNNVWTDLGDVTVTYPADTKLYIEKLTQPSEDDLVANQAITSGQYFMIGNSLYLALANIASGAAITIGTNAQRVSLADALNTINS